MPLDQRRGPLRLEAVEDRRGPVLLEPGPPRGDVARVPHRDGEGVRRLAELVAGLEGRGLLPLDPVRVDGVDQLHRVLGRQLPAVLPVEAQMIASAPAPLARETATVMPRSLKLPVGFAPSNLRYTSAPTRSVRRGEWISGVEPSLSVTTGSPSSRGSRSR